MRTDTLVALGTAALLVATAPLPVDACACAFRTGAPVQITNQEILVAWDAKTKLEHFVRRAEFATSAASAPANARDFGFLVPTPAQPTLAEAENAAFDRLDQAIEPEVKEETKWEVIPAAFCLCIPGLKAGRATGGGGATATCSDVRVLDAAHLAGYDAVVLEADDAAALTRWLKAHDFESRPEITDWVAPYVAAHWKVTAFRFAPTSGETGSRVPTRAIRMSFPTDQPLFPYRVPSDNRDGWNLLRVFYVGAERAEGALLGPAGTARAPSQWNAQTKYANALATLPELLKGAVPDSDVPVNGWLTAFEDHRWPSSGDDLFFSPAKEKAPLLPPPIIERHRRIAFVPLDVIFLVGGLVLWRVRRKKKPAR